MLHEMIDKIRKLGVEVQHIPAGCACYCQPVDVRFNKPFKSRICCHWHDWIIEYGKEKLQLSHQPRQN